MKKSQVLALVVGVILSIAAPALAKGVDQVTVDDGETHLTVPLSDSENTPTNPLVEGARFFDGLWIQASGPRSGVRQSTPPSGDLGEAITLEWRFGDIDTEMQGSSVVQYVYLDAAGGPVAYIAGGQAVYDSVTLESWFPVATNLPDTLSDLGFGTAAAVAPRVSGGEANGKASTDDSSTWLWLVVSLAGLAAIAVLVQSGALRRRTQRTA